jgi:membrane protein required for colicin V production
MLALDVALLILMGGFAVRGFMAGFVTEALALGALVLAIVAVHLAHAPVADLLGSFLGTKYGAAMLAFALVFGMVYGLGKWVARAIGRKSKSSILGMVDRLLGLGFGAIKGLLIATVGFVVFSIGYDALYGAESPRPDWMRLARSYPLLSASGTEISEWLAENSRHGGLLGRRGNMTTSRQSESDAGNTADTPSE